MADYPTTKELQESIAWAIQQGGDDNYILNDNSYPYNWGYYLHVIKEQKGLVMKGQTNAQIFAALAGEPQPTEDELPKYNIDWDIRSSISGDFLTLKKKSGEKVTMMGTFDFDTSEQGAERWLEQIKERVVKGLWTTDEERKTSDEEINKSFQAFYDKHCSEQGDCELKDTCPVRWPGGFGLQGCTTKQENIVEDKKRWWK